jgi:hypothetical protein
MGLGEALILFDLCLVFIALALVLNVKSKKLGCLEVRWLRGIYSLNHQSGRWGGCLSMGAPDSPVRQLRHPTVRVRLLELCQMGPPDSPVVHRTATIHCLVRLLAPALTLRALFVHCSAFTGFRWSRPLRCSRCFAGTPDSPVNYSGVAFPGTRRWRVRVNSPWCTGHYPVAPFFLNPILDFLLVCVKPLAPVELII